MTTLSGHGLSATLPRRWEGRVFVPDLPPPAINLPVLHAASFRLPADEATFGSEAARVMGGRGALMALVEYDPALGGFGLFETAGPPPSLRPSDFDPNALQVRRAGQAGMQRFFTWHGRALCLYVVLGTAAGTVTALAEANTVLTSMDVVRANGERSP
ncbi:MAG TPA: hypothetical protein VGH10_00305 [Actinomycetota bacterium]|jgi:hypothetical protein